MRSQDNIKAQSTIEFTFAMIVVMFLIYGMVMVFRWGGMDLVNRRVAQEAALVTPVTAGDLYSDGFPGDPEVQLNSDVGGTVMPMAALYHGSITNGNEIP